MKLGDLIIVDINNDGFDDIVQWETIVDTSKSMDGLLEKFKKAKQKNIPYNNVVSNNEWELDEQKGEESVADDFEIMKEMMLNKDENFSKQKPPKAIYIYLS